MPARIDTTKQIPTEIEEQIQAWIDNPLRNEHLVFQWTDDDTIRSEDLHLDEGDFDANHELEMRYSVEIKVDDNESQHIIKPGANALEQHVIDWLNEEAKDNGGSIIDIANDLSQGGCESGIGGLTYYTDCNEFFDRFESDIEEVINNLELDFGSIIRDSFSMSIIRQRLSWTAFEETVRNLMNECEIDY